MITSFEVGAVFRILDEASPGLRKILAQVRALNKAVEQARIALADMLKSLNVSMDPAIAETRALAAEWKSVSVAAQGARRSIASAAAASAVPGTVPRVARVGSVPGVNRGGRGGGRGFVTEGIGMPMPGGVRGYFRAGHSGHGTAAMIGAGALAYGIYKEAELEDALFQMKWHAGMANTPENDKYFRDLIQNTAASTGFNYREIAEAATDEIRLLKGAGGKESGGLGILPEMLRAAATEAKVKPGTGLKGAMDSLVQQAHMAQEYGLDDIKGMAPLLAFLSTTNPATMPQMVRAASYAMPTLHSALGINPADVLYETTAIARAGATNTKSGTWVRAAFERLLPPDRRLTSPNEYARRMIAMRQLGLADGKGNSTVLDATGHIDIDKALERVNDYTKGMSITDRNNFMKKTFGEQGQRGMSLMMTPAVVAQTNELKREFPEFKGRYGTFMEDYGNASPIQKARQTWEDMTNVLADIGTTTLPPLNRALHDFDDILKSIQGILPKGSGSKDSVWGKVGAAALEGFAGGALVGSVTGPGMLATGLVTGAVSGGLKAGEIWLGLDNDKADSVKKFGGAVSDSGAAAQSATSALAGLAKMLRDLVIFGGTQTVPAAPHAAAGEKHSDVILDGEKVGKVVMRRIASRSLRPLEGSAYHDTTWNSPASDTVLSMG